MIKYLLFILAILFSGFLTFSCSKVFAEPTDQRLVYYNARTDTKVAVKDVDGTVYAVPGNEELVIIDPDTECLPCIFVEYYVKKSFDTLPVLLKPSVILL